MPVEEMDNFLMKEVVNESLPRPGKLPLHVDSVQVCFTLCHIV